MTIFRGLLLALVVTASATGSERPLAQRVPNRLVDSLLTAGIDKILSQRYEESKSVFQRLARDFPGHPAGFLYQAAVLQAQAMDYEERLNGKEFDSLLVLSKERSESMITTAPGSPWGFYYLGTTLGYDSYAKAERGDWFGAVTKGMSAASYFEKAIGADSTFYDAYAGIGTYYYWKSRKIEFLTWIPFVRDSREEGIRLLNECVERGTYNRYAAMSSLIAIFSDAGRHAEASVFARRALLRYPDNRIFLWGLATAQEKSGSLDSAAHTYERLLRSILNDSRPNFYNELVCRLNLFLLKQTLGHLEEQRTALSAIQELESVRFPDHLKERAAEKFKKARQLEAELTKISPER